MPPDDREVRYTIGDEIRRFHDERRSKVLVLQRMDYDDGRVELRLGYYIIGKKPKMKGRWVWGQFAAMLPAAIFRELYQEAEAKGWFNHPDA